MSLRVHYVTLMGLAIGRIADLSVVAAFAVMGGIVVLGALLLRIDEQTAGGR